MSSKMVIRILSISLALVLSAMLCPTLTSGAVDISEESGSSSLTSLDFGAVAVGSSSQETLVVTNTNDKVITLLFTSTYNNGTCNCNINFVSAYKFVGVGVGDSVNVTLEYEPLAECAVSGSLYIFYTTEEETPHTGITILSLAGTGVPETVPKAPDFTNIFIDGQDTGVLDFVWQGRKASEWLNDCTSARNHGEYVRCVALLAKNMEKGGPLNKEQKGAIVKAAAHANIPPVESGLEDLSHDGTPITDLIKECKEEAKNNKQYTRCVSDLMKEMKKKGEIETRKDKHLIRRYAARLRFHSKPHK